MIGDLPAEAIHADPLGELTCQRHFRVTVVPPEQNVAPVEERDIRPGSLFFIGHRAEGRDGEVEPAALPVFHVAFRRRAIDRKRHLIDARVHQPARLLFGQRQAVGAGVQVNSRKPRLDVFAHLDRALVQERLAVVEKVDSHERGADLVDDAAKKVEVQHSGLARSRDAGFRRAARLVAGNVAGGGALDVQARRHRAGIGRPHDRRVVFFERQLQRTIAAEPRAAGVEIQAKPGDRLTGPHVVDRRRARISEHPVAVGIGTPAHDAPVAEHDERAPRPGTLEARGEEV